MVDQKLTRLPARGDAKNRSCVADLNIVCQTRGETVLQSVRKLSPFKPFKPLTVLQSVRKLSPFKPFKLFIPFKPFKPLTVFTQQSPLRATWCECGHPRLSVSSADRKFLVIINILVLILLILLLILLILDFEELWWLLLGSFW